MKKFIYVFTEQESLKLQSEGFTLITKCILGKHEAYVFENNPKSLNFSEHDKKALLFTNMMYF